MKRRDFNKSFAAATAVSLSPFSLARIVRAATTAGGATPVFSYPNGFAGAGSAINLFGADLIGSTIRMIATEGHNSAGVWYTTQQPSTAFTTQFTWQPNDLGATKAESGMTFCIQNTVLAETVAAGYGYYGVKYAGDANMCGYGGALNQFPPPSSVAIKFDAGDESIGQAYPAGALPSSTGMYLNGGPSPLGGSIGLVPFNGLSPYGISFYNTHIYQVTIVYDGSLLTMVLLDTTTNAQARLVWPLNLANTTGSSVNWVGFTAGTAARGYFNLLSWSYSSGYNTRLTTPTFSPPAGQYSSAQAVSISYPSGSTCYYTTNGLLPTSSSTQYTGPITVGANEVLQAIAIQSGFTDSLVQTGAYQINTSNVINFPNGFSSGSLVNVGFAYLSGAAYRLTDTTPVTAGAVWFAAPVTVATFSTAFTLQWGSAGQGMCFVIQNNPPLYAAGTANTALNWSGGPTVVGSTSNALGYGGLNANSLTSGTAFGLLNSVAIAFDQWFVANSVGLYTNGATPTGSQIPTGLLFSSGHPINVSLSYSGTTLTLSMTDTVTGAKFTHSFTIDIPSTVGGSTAYVGFTGGTGGAASIQSVTAWTYTASQTAQAPAVPVAPTNLRVQ